MPPIEAVGCRREMSWAEFEARITSTPVKKFFEDFPAPMLKELWRSSWIHVLPASCSIPTPTDGRPLIYIVALGVIQLQPDPAAPAAPSPFAMKAGSRLFPGDAATTDRHRTSQGTLPSYPGSCPNPPKVSER